jgi:hypothetical protein
MTDEAHTGGLTGATGEGGRGDAQRGHGRRAVLVGAAVVGAGAVAAMAGPAGAASAATSTAATSTAAPKGAVTPAGPITVRLPAGALSIDVAMKVLQNVLGQAGCAGCFSGYDIHFVHELEYFVNVDGAVQPGV